MKQSAIARVIERDLLCADAGPSINTTKCFMCGYGMVYRGSRFCSPRCRDCYEQGNPGYFQDWLQPKIIYRCRDGCAMKIGAHGFLIACAHCGKEFDSKGLRCCSSECERAYREREDNVATMAEVGIQAAPKRQCQTCGARIPKWRNGRRVRNDVRFCSRKCASRCQTPETENRAG